MYCALCYSVYVFSPPIFKDAALKRYPPTLSKRGLLNQQIIKNAHTKNTATMSNHGGKRKVAVTGTPLARLLQGCATAEGASEGFLVGSKRDEETIGDSDEKDVVTVYEIQAVVFQPVFANGALTQLPENIIGWFRV